MRALFSTIGSRGDVQPLLALALEVRALGHDVRLCAPPDFMGLADDNAIPFVPIGPALRPLTATAPRAPMGTVTPEQRRQMIEGTVATQFQTVMSAADGCDIIVGATALQVAAPSVAETLGVPYVFAAYCPTVLPSPHHAPIPLGMLGDPGAQTEGHGELWRRDAERWNSSWGAALNAQRAALGLAPVTDVRSHVLTPRPWLAADAVLAPWPGAEELAVVQDGAWVARDDRPLARDVEAFLDAGDPPLYVGFGSMRAPHELGRAIVDSARALGRRAIVSRGWAGLFADEQRADCLVIDEVNQQALFPRVAAVVHHGGAGTTTAAAMAGVPQLIVPQMYDQPWWGMRIAQLGAGVTHTPGAPTTEALESVLAPSVREAAASLASRMRPDGARRAAERLHALLTA